MSVSVFSHIVLTAPSEKIAQVYALQVAHLRSTVPFLASIEIFCVSDPEGCRIGSGGGTLNALDNLVNIIGKRQLDASRVLIIHSGGDSRRAPLYSLCGKAWSTINATIEDAAELASPLLLLILEINNFCAHLPCGSLVVASSDVMLHIAAVSNSGPSVFPPDSVSVVCVPAATKVAKNHGVFIGDIPESSDGFVVRPASRYLQKPSEVLMDQIGAVFTRSYCREPFALIDSGVVIFSGAALSQLVQLLDSESVGGRCTAGALISGSEEGRSREVLRFELYTELLLALRVKEAATLEEYHTRLGLNNPSTVDSESVYGRALSVIHSTLHRTALHLIFVPGGCFEHLGTTQEVMELLSACHSVSIAAASSFDAVGKSKHRLFASKYYLSRSVMSSSSGSIGSETSRGAILMNSCTVNMLDSHPSSSSSGSFVSVVEHSLVCSSLTTTLNSSCASSRSHMLSHLSALLSSQLNFSSSHCMMLQQVRLRPSDNREGGSRFVLLLLGIQDNIKALETVCGQSWTDFMKGYGCLESDLFGSSYSSVSPHTLWDAKLFPVCRFKGDEWSDVWVESCDGQEQFKLCNTQSLSWFSDLNGASASEVVDEWRKARRLSLSDLLNEGDAGQMLQWRLWCTSLYECSAQYYHKGRGGGRVEEADRRLIDASVAFEAISRFFQTSSDHSEAVCLLLWCVSLMTDSVRTPLLSAALRLLSPELSPSVVESVVASFLSLRADLTPLVNHSEVCLVVGHYLKRLVTSDQTLLRVTDTLLSEQLLKKKAGGGGVPPGLCLPN